jgi:GNAT superfamily N-acetyltransferase
VNTIQSQEIMVPGSFQIIPFTRSISREEFSCGNSSLDTWLKIYAGQNEDKFLTRTFMAVEADSKYLAGYCTTVFGETGPAQNIDGLPISKYSRPAFLIAKLAVDLGYQGQGVGKLLLADALRRACNASEVAGLELVIVDAINSEAVSFYGRFGFTRLDPGSRRMFLKIASLWAD